MYLVSVAGSVAWVVFAVLEEFIQVLRGLCGQLPAQATRPGVQTVTADAVAVETDQVLLIDGQIDPAAGAVAASGEGQQLRVGRHPLEECLPRHTECRMNKTD